MTIYWERCDICGGHRPTKKCSLIPDMNIDIHCCITCLYWMNKCRSPAWRIEAKITSQPARPSLTRDEKEKLLRELTALLEKT